MQIDSCILALPPMSKYLALRKCFFSFLVSNITPLFSFQSQTGMLGRCSTITTCLLCKNHPNHRTTSLSLTILLTLFKGLYEQVEVDAFIAFTLTLKSKFHQGRDRMYLFLSEHNSFHTNIHGMGGGKGDLTMGLMECEMSDHALAHLCAHPLIDVHGCPYSVQAIGLVNKYLGGLSSLL